MIGIGVDLVDVHRFRTVLQRRAQISERLFTKNELSDCNLATDPTERLAARFAAKEATWKALSPTRGEGLFFREIEVLNDKNGRPYLNFTGKTKKYLEKKENQLEGKLKFDISLSDEPPFVIAFVIISLAPKV